MKTRPYKMDTPKNTVNKIKKILLTIDCPVQEEHIANPYDEIFSLRVETHKENGLFGANGKGRTLEYAQASAYAEFIERLQNGLLTGTGSLSRRLLEKIKKETGFYYYPDEQYMGEEEFRRIPKEIINDVTKSKDSATFEIFVKEYFKRLKENGYRNCIAVPFYDYKNKKETLLPHNIIQMLTGSNGMAAGNTLEEAKFQALCEILERYAASEIYYNRLTPPTIPKKLLKNMETYKLIEKIEEKGNYQVIVKDLSCSKKLPVLGVIIVDLRNNRYRLNIGSDTNFEIALSRCLTEIYQGILSNEQFDDLLIPIPSTEYKYFLDNDQISINNRNERFISFIRNGSGAFPKSLFNNEPSYQVDISSFPNGHSYSVEVEYLLSLLLKYSDNVYFRDVSFLGFPTVYFYIPKLSRVGKKTSAPSRKSIDFDYVTKFDQIEDLFFPFDELNESKIEKLVNLIDYSKNIIDDFKMKELLKLEFVENSDWNHLPGSYFITLFWVIVGNYERAIHNLKSFMISTGNDDDNYYNIILEYFKFKNINCSDKKIFLKLSQKGFKHNLIEDVINSFSKKSLFEYIKVPNCPDCNNCALSNDCITKNKINFLIRIHKRLKRNWTFL